jgi:2-polyprenyl-3-methyl-5-hydroxy-6-metoxy-1,4-benzoquinol methylase
MKRWTRDSLLALPDGKIGRENWVLRDGDDILASYPIDTTMGKPLDVLKLRSETIKELKDYATQFRGIVSRLYADPGRLHMLSGCPCCRSDLSHSSPAVEVYGVSYVRCGTCAHVFIPLQPKPADLIDVFESEEDLSTFYVDPDTLAMRLKDIVQPKLDWVLDVYRRYVGRDPIAALDVGAGGGHFVACCRRNALHADGVELSRASVRFAREALGVDLRQGNYLDLPVKPGQYDLLTFWGLLEYAPDPGAFLAAARRQLVPDKSMLVIEVPRSDSLCLAVQKEFARTVWRHAMPDSHMNLYSDASLATLFHDNGFRPVAAWYFGMDVYELLMQIGMEFDSDEVLHRLGRLVSPLQGFVDQARLSDDIVVAAVPYT